MIYLTESRTLCTENIELIDDVAYPQKVHWFPESYAKKDTGMVYVPHKVADKVLDGEILKTLRENPIKTAFILASGNCHFSGIEPKLWELCLKYRQRLKCKPNQCQRIGFLVQ